MDLRDKTVYARNISPQIVIKLFSVIKDIEKQLNRTTKNKTDFRDKLIARMKTCYNFKEKHISDVIDAAVDQQLIIKREKFGQIRYKINTGYQLNNMNDWYCFVCHTNDENCGLIGCQCCWRSFHHKCIDCKQTPFLCDYCQTYRENIKERKIPLKQSLLQLLNRCVTEMKKCNEFMEMFDCDEMRQIEDFNDTLQQNEPKFNCLVFKKFNLKLISYKVHTNAFPNLKAFEFEFNRHFAHNLHVSYLTDDKKFEVLSKICSIFDNELNDLKLCAQCYQHKCSNEQNWFCKPCSPVHQLVFAKDRTFALWPAKLISGSDETHFNVKWFDPPHYTNAIIPLKLIKPFDRIRCKITKYEKPDLLKAKQMLSIHLQILKDNGIEPAITITSDVERALNKIDGKRMKRLSDDNQRKNKRIKSSDVHQTVDELKTAKLTVEMRHHLFNTNKILNINLYAIDSELDVSDNETELDIESNEESVDETQSTCTVDEQTNNEANATSDLFQESGDSLDEWDICASDCDIQSMINVHNAFDFDDIVNIFNNEQNQEMENNFDASAVQTELQTQETNQNDKTDENVENDETPNNQNDEIDADVAVSDERTSDETDKNRVNRYEKEVYVNKQQLNVECDISSAESNCFDDESSSNEENSVTFMDIVNHNYKLSNHSKNENNSTSNMSKSIQSIPSDKEIIEISDDECETAVIVKQENENEIKLRMKRDETVKKILNAYETITVKKEVKKEIKREIKNEYITSVKKECDFIENKLIELLGDSDIEKIQTIINMLHNKLITIKNKKNRLVSKKEL